MKRKKLQGGDRSTGIALLFFLFCGLLIGGGLLVKLALVFLSAKFDGSHQVILEVQNTPTSASLISLSPDSQSASVVRVMSSSSDFGKYLGIPVDLKVEADPSLQLSDLGQYILFHPHSDDTLNMIDRIRVFLFTSQLKASDITEKSITSDTSQMTLDQMVPQLFSDHTLYTENQTIAIVNATGVSGLGSNVAKLVTDIGGNVISVTTGDNVNSSSLVYYGNKSYTTQRLSEIFHVTPQNTTSVMLTDVVITIGKHDAARFQ